MNLLQAINLGLRFVLELCLLAALGYWGFQLNQDWLLRLLAGLAAPLLAAAIWGMWVAPKAANQLGDPARFGVEVVLFALGAGGLWLADRPFLAIALLATYLLNRLILTVLGAA